MNIPSSYREVTAVNRLHAGFYGRSPEGLRTSEWIENLAQAPLRAQGKNDPDARKAGRLAEDLEHLLHTGGAGS